MSNNEQRDELQAVIYGYFGPPSQIKPYKKSPVEQDRELAETILAAGYRKPRTITTVEELDALQGGTLILTEQGSYWEADRRGHGVNWWTEPGRRGISASEHLTLPATVIYEPITEATS